MVRRIKYWQSNLGLFFLLFNLGFNIKQIFDKLFNKYTSMFLSQYTECVKRQYLSYLATGAETQWQLTLLITCLFLSICFGRQHLVVKLFPLD